LAPKPVVPAGVCAPVSMVRHTRPAGPAPFVRSPAVVPFSVRVSLGEPVRPA